MKYFYYQPNKDVAISKWNNSQYDLSDIVLSLTDNHVLMGAKIYAIFYRPEVLNLMQYFVCDFKQIKDDLGIIGDYVERGGDVYSKDYNPKRNPTALNFSIEQMKTMSNNIYKDIMRDLTTIAKVKLKTINY